MTLPSDTLPQPPATAGTGGSDYHRIEAAIRFVVAHAGGQPSLAQLAAFLGLSESHCQRLFHRWAGLTPKDFLKLVTLERAKEAMRRGESVLGAALAAGLSGGGRLHDLFLTIEAVTPGDFQRSGAGLEMAWGVHETPLGEAFFAATERGLCAVRFFLPGEDHADAVRELAAKWPKAVLRQATVRTRVFAQAVSDRMGGRVDQPLALLLKGTAFQTQVWRALLEIPPGGVTTYGHLAEAIGFPRAHRAVGTAVGANPIGYLIPCHRVLRGAGVIGGYRWGTDRKRAALALDAAGAKR